MLTAPVGCDTVGTMTTKEDAAKVSLDDAQYVYLQMLLEGGCTLLFRTRLFGKTYVWMKDRTGVVFLERVPEPQPTEFSVNSETGEVTPV